MVLNPLLKQKAHCFCDFCPFDYSLLNTSIVFTKKDFETLTFQMIAHRTLKKIIMGYPNVKNNSNSMLSYDKSLVKFAS